MLRSPTHIVGHGPTSHSTTTTNSGSHRHIGQNGTANTKKQILFNGASKHQHHTLNHNNNNNGNTKQQHYDATIISSTTSTTTTTQQHQHHQNITTTSTRTSLFDSCHRKIRLIGGGPVAFLGGLVAKARRKERDDQNSADTKLYLEKGVLECKLPDADLKALVDLPAGLDFNEWLASHTLALFEHVNLVYGTISEFCTPSGCPDMTGPGNRTYLWFDEKGKKTRVAAPQYIDYVMTFTQKTVSDESIFPTKYAKEFPSSFESIARKILRLQFHVIAHLYAAHFREIALLGLHTHLNLTFAHLTALHRRFNLIDEKETDVLRDLEVALRLTDDHQQQQQQQQSAASTTTTDPSRADAKRIEDAGGSSGDATMVKPICTQPESMKALSNSDGNNVNILGGGILGSFTANDLIANDSNSFNNGGTSHNNNSNTMLQCNNITSSSQQQQQPQQQQQQNLLHNHQHHNHHSSSSSSPTPSTTTA